MNNLNSLRFLPLLVLIFCSSHAFGNEQKSRYGGVFLEYPQGRFQENEAPNFFKWNLQSKMSSIALKVFKCQSACTIEAKKELVARFDFLPDVQSMNWFGEALPVGHYTWSVEGFDKSSTNPIFADSASFSIEPIMSYGFKTDRIGLMAGFGRGSYGSRDDNYDVEFKTTPTIYGLSYGGGSKAHIWSAKAFLSDFILKGQIDHTMTFSSDFLWQLNVTDPGRWTFFLGPSLRYFNYPQITSVNGTDLDIKNKFIASPGVSFKTQYEIDKYISAQLGIYYDVAVVGSQNVKVQFNNGSLNTSFGLTYGKMWPVGFGLEIQYQKDRILTKPDSSKDDLLIQQSQWAFLGHIFYAL